MRNLEDSIDILILQAVMDSKQVKRFPIAQLKIKLVSLFTATLKEDGAEVIGKNESEAIVPQFYFGETVDSMVANSNRRMIRNELRDEQRQRLQAIIKSLEKI